MWTESRQEAMVDYALTHLHQWYKWGGNDPSGFDCSGFVLEVMQSIGIFPKGYDSSADGLLITSKRKSWMVENPYAGCLVFYCNTMGRATHIAIAVNRWQQIEAAGGGSKTKTIEDAIKHNAFIKLRPIRFGQGCCFADPLKNS